MHDGCTEVKCELFSFVVDYLELYLWQSDRPMVPFMYNDVYKIISDLLKLLIKPDVISFIERGIDLIFDAVHKKNNQLKEVIIRWWWID